MKLTFFFSGLIKFYYFQIAGVALNGISRSGEIENSLKEVDSSDNLQYRLIFGLLFNVNNDINLFKTYNVDKIFELRILSVDSRYRGRGLAKELFMRSELIAEEYGFKVSYVRSDKYLIHFSLSKTYLI